jgi:hypothetical protein
VDGPTGGALTGSGATRIYSPAAGTTEDGFTFTVSDGELTSEPATVTIVVSSVPPPNGAPLVEVGDAAGLVGEAIPMSATATDPDADPLTLAWSADSAACSFSDPSALAPTLTCSAPGQVTVTLAADDGTGTPTATAADTGLVTVTEPEPPPDACHDLYAGQTTDVGDVCVEQLDDSLYVTYRVIDGWLLSETHLAVGMVLGDIPTSRKGNPLPGKFAYSSRHEPGVTQASLEVPLAELGDLAPILIVAAHAEVVLDSGSSASAWAAQGEAGTTQFPDAKQWATYFTYGLELPVELASAELTADGSASIQRLE